MNRLSMPKRIIRGFTFLETIVVAAIIGVLIAIATPNVIQQHKDLKQKERDDTARELFLAAQNDLTRLKTAGLLSLSSPPSGTQLAADEIYYFELVGGTDSSDLPFEKAKQLMQTLSGKCLVYFRNDTGDVTEVLYSQKSTDFDGLNPQSPPSSHDDTLLGLYLSSGYSNGNTEKPEQIIPQFSAELINKEDLYVKLVCSDLDGVATRHDPQHLVATITLEQGETSQTVSLAGTASMGTVLKVDDRVKADSSAYYADVDTSGTYHAYFLLDSMADGHHFHNLYPDLMGGMDVSVSVTLQYDFPEKEENNTLQIVSAITDRSTEETDENGTSKQVPLSIEHYEIGSCNTLFASSNNASALDYSNMVQICQFRHFNNLRYLNSQGVISAQQITVHQIDDIDFNHNNWSSDSTMPTRLFNYQPENPLFDSFRPFAINGNVIAVFDGGTDGDILATTLSNKTIGGQYAIQNLNISRSDTRPIGLFSKAYNHATLQNVTVKHPNLLGKNMVGGLVGLVASNVTINNCVVESGRYTHIKSINQYGCTGGFIGMVQSPVTMKNCRFITGITHWEEDSPDIEGITNVGSFIGKFNYSTNRRATSTLTNCHSTAKLRSNMSDRRICKESRTGGIFGSSANADIALTNCTFSGHVIATMHSSAGGIAGKLFHTNLVMESCRVENTTISMRGSDGANCGGLVGLVQSNSTIPTCTNCHVTQVSLNGTSAVGGLFGMANGSVAITDCTCSAKQISATSAGAGGMIGMSAGSTSLTNCTFSGQSVSTQTHSTGGLIGLTGTAGKTKITDCSTRYADLSSSDHSFFVNGAGKQVGGLVGTCRNALTISNSFSTCAVTAEENGAGGLVGAATGSIDIQNSYYGGTSVQAGTTEAGGILGLYEWGSGGIIMNCYCTGNLRYRVKPVRKSKAGGLIGNVLSNAVGRIILQYDTMYGTITDCQGTQEDSDDIISVGTLTGNGEDFVSYLPASTTFNVMQPLRYDASYYAYYDDDDDDDDHDDDDDDDDEHGHHHGSGSSPSCFYLKYRSQAITDDYADRPTPEGVAGKTYAELMGMVNESNRAVNDYPEGSGSKFPFPAVLTRNGNRVHYGVWPKGENELKLGAIDSLETLKSYLVDGSDTLLQPGIPYHVVNDFSVKEDRYFGNLILPEGTTFDGNNYTIYNLKKPLFYEVTEGSTVTDLTLSQSRLRLSKNDPSIALFADTNNGTITGCNIEGTKDYVVSVDPHDRGHSQFVAGFVRVNNQQIENCSVAYLEITVGKHSDVAGFVLENNGSIKSCDVSNVSINSKRDLSAAGFVLDQNGTIVNSWSSDITVNRLDIPDIIYP